MDDFSSARPNTEEGASHDAQSCKAYVSSFFVSHHRFMGCPVPQYGRFASFRVSDHHCIPQCGRFESFRVVFHGVPNPRTSVVPTRSTSSVMLWLCVVVCLAAMRGTA